MRQLKNLRLIGGADDIGIRNNCPAEHSSR
jgi:hypothetical protein